MLHWALWESAITSVFYLYLKIGGTLMLGAFGVGMYKAMSDRPKPLHPALTLTKCLAIAVCAAGVMAWYSWSGYGTHTEDADPLWGGGTVVDDFAPTDRQRDAHGVWVFCLFFLTLGAGSVRAFWPDGAKLLEARRDAKWAAEAAAVEADLIKAGLLPPEQGKAPSAD